MRPRLSCALLGVALLGLAGSACGGSKPAATTGTTTAPPTTSAPATTTVVAIPAPVTTAGGGALPFNATLTAPTQTPKVNVPWRYEVRVTDADGKPIHATITVEVVDPVQQAHPVQYDKTTKNLVDWPIDGVFRDDVTWPASGRGFTLTFRVTVHAGGATAQLTYPVVAR